MKRSTRGIALVSVLWGVSLLSLLAGTFLMEARSDTKIARNNVSNTQSRLLADGGIYRAIALLETRRMEESFVADGRLMPLSSPIGALRISIQDEDGKVDLNTARPELLIALFEGAGVENSTARALADAVIDWRDKNSTRSPRGAEDNDYSSAGYDYGAKDNLFDSVEELRRVFNMTPAIYERVHPAVTVYSGKRGVDLKSAPQQIVSALAKDSQEQVNAYLQARSQFGNTEQLPSFLRTNAIRRLVTSSSRQAFTIRSVAEIRGGGKFVREAVVRFRKSSAQSFQILAWRQVVDSDGVGFR